MRSDRGNGALGVDKAKGKGIGGDTGARELLEAMTIYQWLEAEVEGR